jgi:hypothetical protein
MDGSRRVLALFSMSESNSDARQAEAIARWDALVAPIRGVVGQSPASRRSNTLL